MHVKTVKVSNAKNILVQIPGFIAKNWALTEDDSLEVHLSEDGKAVIIKPRKGFINVRTGGPANG